MATDQTELTPFLADVQMKTIRDLEALARIPALTELPTLTDVIDVHLRHRLETTLVQAAPTVIFGAHTLQKAAAFFAVEGRVYEIRTQEDIIDSTRLGVAILARHLQTELLCDVPHSVPVPGNGRYQFVNLYLPRRLQVDSDGLAAITSGIFATGYRWLRDYVERIIVRSEADVTQELYRYLRSIIHNEQLLANLWLSASNDGKAHYILDHCVALPTLELVTPVAGQLGHSPARILAEFINADVPIESTHGLVAAGVGKCIDIDLSHSKYKDDLPLLNTAQAAVFGSDSLSMYPILWERRSGYLVAVFPTAHKSAIVPILDAHHSQLAARYRTAHDQIRRLMRRLRAGRASSRVFGEAGEFMGGFFRGVMDL